jgi:uncharacterized protein YecE (DUF72 family)
MSMKRLQKETWIGTAGWSLSRDAKPYFPEEGSHLERYAQRLNAAEINTTFYRHHEAKTFMKWAEAVPANFRFSVKLSREVTHDLHLELPEKRLKEILDPYFGLGKKFGTLLVQLPPGLIFQKSKVEIFFKKMRNLTDLPLVCEPRHLSWASDESLKCFQKYDVAKVVADPELCPIEQGELWNACGQVHYFRLHGSPIVYRSSYSAKQLDELASVIEAEKKPAWVIFDNTAESHAIANALTLSKKFD